MQIAERFVSDINCSTFDYKPILERAEKAILD